MSQSTIHGNTQAAALRAFGLQSGIRPLGRLRDRSRIVDGERLECEPERPDLRRPNQRHGWTQLSPGKGLFLRRLRAGRSGKERASEAALPYRRVRL